MAALDGAIAKVDALLTSLDAGLSDRSATPPLRVDPDDPWASSINPPEGVYKARTRRSVACNNSRLLRVWRSRSSRARDG